MNITMDVVDRALLNLFADLGTRRPIDMTRLEECWGSTGLRHGDLFAAARRLERSGDIAVEHLEQDRFLALTSQGRTRVGPRSLPMRLASRFKRFRFRVARGSQMVSHPDHRRRRTDVPVTA